MLISYAGWHGWQGREENISIGGRPKSSKEPNPLNQAKCEAQKRRGRIQRGKGQRGRGQERRGEAQEQGEERQVEEAQEEPQSKIPVQFYLFIDSFCLHLLLLISNKQIY